MDKIRILGTDYIYDDQVEMNNRGEIEFTGKKIRVNKILSNDLKMQTVLHELLEAINTELELNFEHKVISQLDCSLKAIFMDNPKLKDIMFPEVI